MEKSFSRKRMNWIDCAKFIAICAVVVDHCNGSLYTNPRIATASYFSVSLFVLLSGITAWTSNEKSGDVFHWSNDAKRVLKLFLSYALAVAIYQIRETRFFDVKQYISNALSFKYSEQFYFVLFFIQLTLLSSFLMMWIKFCNSKRHSTFYHIGTIGILCILSAVLIRYTYVLPVHGGGQYILGGTYLLLYYMGILCASKDLFQMRRNAKLICIMISFTLWVIWWHLMCVRKLPFDKYLQLYWGGGFNPPSVNFMVFALITLFLCYAFFSTLDEINNRYISKIMKIVCYLGRQTWYIFLYHLLVKTIVSGYFTTAHNIWIYRIVVFSAMILLPVIWMSIVQFIKKKVRLFISTYAAKGATPPSAAV